MCLVSERGQTRAWIFITCTATRWRRPIHQTELSRWSQTFPIKTPSPTPPHSLSLALRKQEVHSHGRIERKGSVKEQGDLFCTVLNFKTSTHIPSLTSFSRLHWLYQFSLVSAFSLGLFLAIIFINTVVTGLVNGQKRAGKESMQLGSLGRY